MKFQKISMLGRIYFSHSFALYHFSPAEEGFSIRKYQDMETVLSEEHLFFCAYALKGLKLKANQDLLTGI